MLIVQSLGGEDHSGIPSFETFLATYHDSQNPRGDGTNPWGGATDPREDGTNPWGGTTDPRGGKCRPEINPKFMQISSCISACRCFVAFYQVTKFTQWPRLMCVCWGGGCM